jgi:hypothetical protein
VVIEAYALVTSTPVHFPLPLMCVQTLHQASVALEHEGTEAMDPEVYNMLLNLPSPSSTTNRGKTGAVLSSVLSSGFEDGGISNVHALDQRQ